MKIKMSTVVLGVMPMALLAWQSQMVNLGITQSGLQAQVERALRQYGNELTLPWFGPKTNSVAKAMSEQTRAAAVREIGAAVKALVMSKPFVDAHAAYIKESFKAVDHGLKLQSPEEKHKAMMAGGDAAIDEAAKQAATQMAQVFLQLPAAQLVPMFQSDLESWERQSKSRNAKTAAEGQRLYSKAKELQGLISSDPERFKKGYVVLKSAEMGGAADLSALEASGSRMQQEQEQAAWDKHSLKAVLRNKLTMLVAEASSVDFAAQTVQQGTRVRFANAAYERKSPVWKAMYRAGKAPTAALAEFSRAWLKEL